MNNEKLRLALVGDSGPFRQLVKGALQEISDIEYRDFSPLCSDWTFPSGGSPEVVILDWGESFDHEGLMRDFLSLEPAPKVLAFCEHKSEVSEAVSQGVWGTLEHPKTAVGERNLATLEKDLSEFLQSFRLGRGHKSFNSRAIKPDPFLPDLVVIGASAGGPKVLAQIFGTLRSSFSLPIVVVQHYEEIGARALLDCLKKESKLPLHLVEGFEVLLGGTVYLAPPNSNVRVFRSKRYLKIGLESATESAHEVPSVDRLFETAADSCGQNLLGIVLTGMGNDGVEGAKFVHQRGGRLIAQCEESSLVFGMAKRLIESGTPCRTLPLHEISEAMMACCPVKG